MKQIFKSWQVLGLSLLAMQTLTACTDPQDDLRTWMEEEKKSVKPTVKPIDPPKKFTPEPYLAFNSVDPFSGQKLTVALKQEAKQPNPLLVAEMNRRHEPLEAYPLDSMAMVGSVNKNNQRFALLKVDNLLYQVKVGDHIGQNNGRILSITETEVRLREIVQDASGDLTERTASLMLQEKTK